MSNDYRLRCDCGSVELSTTGLPKVHAFCHCEDCRNLLDVPYHSIVAWNAENVQISDGAEHAVEYPHPTLSMTRVFCQRCGETLYNTNAMGWKLVSQLLISKRNNGALPPEFRSNAHFFYDRRVIDIDDDIPKS